MYKNQKTFIFNIKNLLKNSTKHKACMESNIGTKETLKEDNKNSNKHSPTFASTKATKTKVNKNKPLPLQI
jgi:hypothetical protein